MFCLTFPDCESLVRKMLVRDPERRFTINQVKQHHWMQAEVPVEVKQELERQKIENATTSIGLDKSDGSCGGRKCDNPLNEEVLKIISDLGIDTKFTREVSDDDGAGVVHHSVLHFRL